jgi:hypothetical protein
MTKLVSILSCWFVLVGCAPAFGDSVHFIDDEGVFVAAPSADAPLPEPNRSREDIQSLRGSGKPVRCRLIDYVDCTTGDTHDFTDDGESRVLDLPGGKFRVTSRPSGFELKWFQYTVATADKAGRPHLIVLESPNDRERYTTASITMPEGAAWSPPYEGEEKHDLNGFGLYQSPFWLDKDVGLNVYTGRELPIDNKAFRWHFVCYPKSAKVWLTISSSGWNREKDDRIGGAVSKIWVFEVIDDLGDRTPAIDPPDEGKERYFGIYTTHPWYFISHYGVPPITKAQRKQSLEKLCDLMKFCGMNFMEFNAINGSDRSGRAWFPGSHYPQCGTDPDGRTDLEKYPELPVDLLTELPPVAAERGIDIVPVLTSLTVPGLRDLGDKPNKYGFSKASIQLPADPNTNPQVFHTYVPDPLRPETQKWLTDQVIQIARRSRQQSNIVGIGFRVNGKIGTCYTSGEDKSSGETKVVDATKMGYTRWHLQQFRKDTKLDVPMDSLEAYNWLKADAGRWDKWLDWRCRRTHDFWLRVRDAVRRVRSDFQLYVLTDLPSEVPGTNITWPGLDAPDAAQVSLDLLRGHGFDPRMFKDEEGIVIQRIMMADMERLFGKWGPPWGSNPSRYRDFHEQDEVAGWYRTSAGAAVEVYRTYWEEAYHPLGEFGWLPEKGGMRTATGTPKGRAFYRPMAYALRTDNCDTMVLTGWQRPNLGHEHDLRRFAQAMRALPATDPRPVKTVPADAKIAAGWYGDRLGIINDRPQPVKVRITLEKPLAPGKKLVDVANGNVLIEGDADQRSSFRINLLEYEIRTLVVRP